MSIGELAAPLPVCREHDRGRGRATSFPVPQVAVERALNGIAGHVLEIGVDVQTPAGDGRYGGGERPDLRVPIEDCLPGDHLTEEPEDWVSRLARLAVEPRPTT